MSDVFDESIDNGEIDKPNVFIDSRWTPYLNDRAINEHFELQEL